MSQSYLVYVDDKPADAIWTAPEGVTLVENQDVTLKTKLVTGTFRVERVNTFYLETGSVEYCGKHYSSGTQLFLKTKK